MQNGINCGRSFIAGVPEEEAVTGISRNIFNRHLSINTNKKPRAQCHETFFVRKLERSLDWAGKACQRQTL